MMTLCRKLAPIFLLLLAFTFVEAGVSANYADARSFSGGRSFRMTPRAPSGSSMRTPYRSGGSFGRGLAGGMLGGALGSMLFGSMFGGGGSGMGILPLLVLGGIAYFLFKKYTGTNRNGNQSYRQYSGQQNPADMFGGAFGNSAQPPPPTPDIGGNLVEEGVDQIRQHDRNFDANHFKEVASDVFFQIQAGWMRRDLDSYKHLSG